MKKAASATSRYLTLSTRKMVSRQILHYVEPHLFQRQFVQVTTEVSKRKAEVKSCFYRRPSQSVLAHLYFQGKVGVIYVDSACHCTAFKCLVYNLRCSLKLRLR